MRKTKKIHQFSGFLVNSLASILLILLPSTNQAQKLVIPPVLPVIAGDWWCAASTPHNKEFNNPGQEIADNHFSQASC